MSATATLDSPDTTTEVLTPEQGQGVRATDKAIQHILKQMETDPEALGFRLEVKRTGCSGWMYVVDFVHTQRDDDHLFPVHDALTIYIDHKSLDFVRGTEIDFISEGLTRQLVFNNPNVTAECGCGESFSIN